MQANSEKTLRKNLCHKANSRGHSHGYSDSEKWVSEFAGPGDSEVGKSSSTSASASSPELPSSVSVILPALNEAGAIGRVLDEIPRDRIRALGCDLRILVIDGNSNDETRIIAEAHGAEVILQAGNGKGGAIRQVHEFLLDEYPAPIASPSPNSYFIIMDADGTYPGERIVDIVKALQAGYDLVLGSRFLRKMEPGAMPYLNRVGNRVLTFGFRFLYGIWLSDVCTGMYGFSNRVLRNLTLHANGFDIEADVFASACEMNARMKEVPVVYRCRIGAPNLIPLRAGALIGWRILIDRFREHNGRPLNGSFVRREFNLASPLRRRRGWGRGRESKDARE